MDGGAEWLAVGIPMDPAHEYQCLSCGVYNSENLAPIADKNLWVYVALGIVGSVFIHWGFGVYATVAYPVYRVIGPKKQQCMICGSWKCVRFTDNRYRDPAQHKARATEQTTSWTYTHTQTDDAGYSSPEDAASSWSRTTTSSVDAEEIRRNLLIDVALEQLLITESKPSWTTIAMQYRKLAKIYHPDMIAGSNATKAKRDEYEAKFRMILKAYKYLESNKHIFN